MRKIVLIQEPSDAWNLSQGVGKPAIIGGGGAHHSLLYKVWERIDPETSLGLELTAEARRILFEALHAALNEHVPYTVTEEEK